MKLVRIQILSIPNHLNGGVTPDEFGVTTKKRHRSRPYRVVANFQRKTFRKLSDFPLGCSSLLFEAVLLLTFSVPKTY